MNARSGSRSGRRSALAALILIAVGGSTAFNPQAAEAGTNLLVNPSFESTGSSWLSPWYFVTRSGAAGSIAQSSATSSAGAFSALVNVTGASASAPWLVQLSQSKLGLVSGTTYTVSFAAKAGASRSIETIVQQTASPYTTY